MAEKIEDPLFSGPCKNIKDWPQTQWKVCDTSATLHSNAISSMKYQIKIFIEDELNSLLQGRGLVNRGATGEVKSLHALKLGDQEGRVSWKITVPGRFGGLRQILPNMLCFQGIASPPMWGVITHILDPNRRTPWSTALNNVPNPCTFVPSLLRICNICAHFFCAFGEFPRYVAWQ